MIPPLPFAQYLPLKYSFKVYLISFKIRILVWYKFEVVLFGRVLDPCITYIFFKILLHKLRGQNSKNHETGGNGVTREKSENVEIFFVFGIITACKSCKL